MDRDDSSGEGQMNDKEKCVSPEHGWVWDNCM